MSTTFSQYPGVFADGGTTRPTRDTGIRQVNCTDGLAVGCTTKQGIEVSYEVTNTGRRGGTDTGQVHVTLPKAAGEPGKRLAAFKQVEPRPGQHKKIKVTIARTASYHPLSIWDTQENAWVTPSGTYTVEAGSSSADLHLKKTAILR
ncbi:fibronectin type III-like domain-contianing protein [Streptomyces sp. NPDC006173]|uniref:fibronectin type III-like domain-contianing protein n=1 Tax=Streptomyces sp. NPDC006173 TaxID=3155349 RepID=UPI00340038C6